SVLEHVPPAERPAFAREVMRLAPRVMLQTPAFEFPIEPHFVVPFLHWLPRWLGYPIAAVSPWRLIGRPHRNTLREFYFGTKLLTKSELTRLFPGCRIAPERFLFLVKSHYVVRGATS
ncbi:MAG: class I SAM-dependent methyltransferase, partial [Caulobacteraceae bacterium]|nr:class I SAM-dependent methyltransferase [Caulobacteraceae bacterium]